MNGHHGSHFVHQVGRALTLSRGREGADGLTDTFERGGITAAQHAGFVGAADASTDQSGTTLAEGACASKHPLSRRFAEAGSSFHEVSQIGRQALRVAEFAAGQAAEEPVKRSATAGAEATGGAAGAMGVKLGAEFLDGRESSIGVLAHVMSMYKAQMGLQVVHFSPQIVVLFGLQFHDIPLGVNELVELPELLALLLDQLGLLVDQFLAFHQGGRRLSQLLFGAHGLVVGVVSKSSVGKSAPLEK